MNKILALRPTWQRFALVALLTLSLLPPSVLGWPGQAVAPAKIATLSVAEQEAAARVQTETIREAVRAVLRDPGYRENAIRLREEMLSLPGSAQAVGLVEHLVRGSIH